MPFRKQGNVKVTEDMFVEPVEEETPEEVSEVIVDSAEYQKIVDRYTDKTGKLSYDLINRDFIIFLNNLIVIYIYNYKPDQKCYKKG